MTHPQLAAADMFTIARRHRHRLGVAVTGCNLPLLDTARREPALGEHVVGEEVEKRCDGASVQQDAQLVGGRCVGQRDFEGIV